jgi:hypothetical protein
MTEIKFAISKGFEIELTELKDGNISASWAGGKCNEIITKEEAEILGLINKEDNLTEKERKVLQSVVDNTLEYGLPVDIDTVKSETKLSKRSIAGVISSLYKKGYVEDYDLSGLDEFMLSESAYEKYIEMAAN